MLIGDYIKHDRSTVKVIYIMNNLQTSFKIDEFCDFVASEQLDPQQIEDVLDKVTKAKVEIDKNRQNTDPFLWALNMGYCIGIQDRVQNFNCR